MTWSISLLFFFCHSKCRSIQISFSRLKNVMVGCDQSVPVTARLWATSQRDVFIQINICKQVMCTHFKFNVGWNGTVILKSCFNYECGCIFCLTPPYLKWSMKEKMSQKTLYVTIFLSLLLSSYHCENRSGYESSSSLPWKSEEDISRWFSLEMKITFIEVPSCHIFTSLSITL